MINNLKLLVSGDSHTVWVPPGGFNMVWVNKLKSFFEQYFPQVTLTNLGIGGTTIGGCMPSSYTYTVEPCTLCQPDPLLNIETILSYNPDFVVISFSGNQFTNRMPVSEVEYCYTTIIDILRNNNIKFLITGQGPRDRTFFAPVTAQTYYNDSTAVNTFLKQYAPNEYCDTYEYMYDTINGLRPWSYLMDTGGLHYNDIGNQEYLNAHLRSKSLDDFLNDYKASTKDFSFTKSGSNIEFSGIIRYNTIEIYGSNDNSTYDLINTYTTPGEERDFVIVNESFVDTGYLWYKIKIIGKRLTKTITKKLN